MSYSEIPGSRCVCHSPRLIAAYHVLRRLPVPRHPPYTLSNLTENPWVARSTLSAYQAWATTSALARSRNRDTSSMKLSMSGSHRARRRGSEFCRTCEGRQSGDDRDRTGDLWLAKPSLSQLSYVPSITIGQTPLPTLGSPSSVMVGLSGVEPLTSRLSGARSNHLSYRPLSTVIVISDQRLASLIT